MSSSDDEEFPLVKYGTPLEEFEENDIPKKPIAVHEQVVTDEQGRRRFHGAFTGGFSAGYYNTVDTKEGWKPSTFRSSRSDRTRKQTYVPEDFMDDEDKSEYGIAPQKIVTQSQFSEAKKNQESLKRKENFSKNATMLLGIDMLESLIVPVSNNIGFKLLQKMGWKPGQGVGPKVKRPKKTDFIPENVTFAPEDTVPMNFNAKDNTFGLGYSGMDPKLALHDKMKKSTAISLRTKSGAKLSFAGQAFGVGAYEDEDQDIYAQDSMANYDLEMGEEKQDNAYGWSKPTKAIEASKAYEAITYVKKALAGFKKAEKLAKRRVYPPPLLPPDYDPHKRLKINQKSEKIRALSLEGVPTFNQNETNEDDKFNRLDPNQRAAMFEERVQSSNSEQSTEPKSIFSLLSPRDRERLEKVKSGNIQSKERNVPVPKNTNFYEPFSSNPSKQERYKHYLELLKQKTLDPYSQIEHDPNMTEWEREQEKEEFIKSSRFFQPLSATMSSRFTSESEDLKQQDEKEEAQKKAAKMKMFGLITRECVEWHPDPLLCKRFNVPNPYPHSDIVGVPGSNADRTLEMFLHPDDLKKSRNPNLSQPKSITPKQVPVSHDKTTGIISDVRNPPTFNQSSRNSSRWDVEATTQGPQPKHETASSQPSEELSTQENNSVKELSEEKKESPPQRPSMELFKAIFENSDDSSSDDEDGMENENMQIKNETSNIEISNQVQNSAIGTSVSNETVTIRTDSEISADVNRPSFHKFSSSKTLSNETANTKTDSETSGISADVNRPAFHRFSSKSSQEKKSPLHEPSTDKIFPSPMEEDVDDAFGPALPPVKIPNLWKSTDPETLKLKKSKKNKHKKDKKHKKKKKHK